MVPLRLLDNVALLIFADIKMADRKEAGRFAPDVVDRRAAFKGMVPAEPSVPLFIGGFKHMKPLFKPPDNFLVLHFYGTVQDAHM